jgi:hypothetical protein
MRSYAEWSRHVALYAAGMVPCPDCNDLLPAGGDEHSIAIRMAHYAICSRQPDINPKKSGQERNSLQTARKIPDHQ